MVLRHWGASVRFWAVGPEGGKPERALSSNCVPLMADLPRGHAWLLRSTEFVLPGVPDRGDSLPLVAFMFLFR